MKKIAVTMALFISFAVTAGNGHHYLGATIDLGNCSLLAGSQGYSYGVFGPGYDDDGTYYPYVNACFGKQRNGGGGSGGGSVDYSWIYARLDGSSGYNLEQCIDVLMQNDDIRRCKPWSGNPTNEIECETVKLTKSETAQLVRKIDRARCVRSVEGPLWLKKIK